MCFYDQIKLSCGDYKWGHFRRHCNREMRVGETCGIKLVHTTLTREDKCKTCMKIEIKQRRLVKEQDRVRRWRKEQGGANRCASVESSEHEILRLNYEIQTLREIRTRGQTPFNSAPLTTLSAKLATQPSPDENGPTEGHYPPPSKLGIALEKAYKNGLLRDPTEDLDSGTLLPRDSSGRSYNSQGNAAGQHSSSEKVANQFEVPRLAGEPTSKAEDQWSDTSSVNSISDSLLSIFTASSISSVATLPGANEKLYALLTTDDLQTLYTNIGRTSGVEKFEQRLRHLIKILAWDLGKESSNRTEKLAANFVRYRARNLAHIISGVFSKEKTPTSAERPENDVEDPNIESELSEADNDSDLEEEDAARFILMESFIAKSNAMGNFKANLSSLVRQNREAEPTVRYFEGTSVVVGDYNLSNVAYSQKVQVSWKCNCGLEFQENVVEYRPGAAQELVASAGGSLGIDVERLAESKDDNSSSSSSSSDNDSSSNISCRRPYQQKEESIIAGKGNDLQPPKTAHVDTKEYILLCRENGNATKLFHADVSKAPCDYSSYHILHEMYYGRRLWRWFTLKEISTVDFVKFHLYWNTNVSIERNDFDVLPPPLLEDYSYLADTKPPVLKTALRHFIKYPNHAPKAPRHRPRIPKKLRDQLVLTKDLGSREGYGLYLQESICWEKVFIIEAIFATCCMAFAVIWCIRNNGGIQDGFAIAGTGIAYGTIMLGALQAISQRR